MRYRYYCPHCNGLLNPHVKVIFVIQSGSRRGLILLSPDLGDYAVVMAESFPLVPGTINRYECPICHKSLTCPSNDKLVEILGRRSDGSEARVAFSRVAGERATFVRGENGLRSFGEDAELYEGVNFFGE